MTHLLTPSAVLVAYGANQLQAQSDAVCLFVDTACHPPPATCHLLLTFSRQRYSNAKSKGNSARS